MKKTKNLISLDLFLYYYLLFIISAYFCDITNLLCKIISINIDAYMPWLILICLYPLYLITRQYLNIKKIKYPIVILIISLCIIIISFVKIPIPDQSFDTINYHLFLQQNRFIDNIHQNFFPNGVQSYLFFLSDSIYYVFRYFLGYRLGTILNSLLLIIIVYQLIEIIVSYIKKNGYYKISSTLYLLVFFGICSIYTLANIGLYYVDLFAIPLILAMLQMILFKNKLTNRQIYFLALLSALSITLKLTFGIFVVPLFIYIILSNYRNISKTTILFCMALILVICCPYFIYIYWETGNPFFPIFNSIFNSVFFDQTNLINQNSPKSFFESILWPLIIFLNPKKLLLQIYDGRLFIGYFLSLLLLVLHYSKIARLNQILLKTVIIFLSFYFLWAFGNGYLRYGLILGVLSALIIFYTIIQLLNISGLRFRLLSLVLGIMLLSQSSYSLYVFLYKPNEWSWRNTFVVDKKQYLTNIPKVINDYHQTDLPSVIKSADAIGIVSYNSGYSALLNIDKPIISFVYNSDNSIETNYFRAQKMNYLTIIQDKKIIIIDKCNSEQKIDDIIKTYGYQISSSENFYHEILNIELCVYELKSIEANI